MRDYAQAFDGFSYDDAVARQLHGSLEAMNACVECCDRHALPGRIALFWEGRDGNSRSWTFTELQALSAQFAGFLKAQGVQPGDRVAGLLPRNAELLVTILGTWRAGAVYQPLFTAFGPKAIEHRLNASGAKIVVTDGANRPKLDDVDGCPAIVTVAGDKGRGLVRGDFSFWAELERQPASFEPVPRRGDDPFLMMFTSGTTGPAKPLLVPLKAIAAFAGYMRDAVDLRAEDAFWNLADPGWAYGLYYAVTGPLALGHPTTFYDGPFTVESTCRVIRKYGITNLAGSPTAYRLLIAAGEAVSGPLRGRLRAVSSAGEPLNPEVIRWFASELGVTIHDHYGQTELGMVLCNHHALAHPVRMGAAGFASPGHRVVVVDDEQRELPPGQPGTLALDLKRSPMCWFGGYHGTSTSGFAGGYYLTGDSAELNDDGSISFIGRADDVITTSGYRVGPFDVESALIEHPAVVEAAVIGKPDPERTELIKAFVVLDPQYRAAPELAEALRQHVRKRLAAHAYPREIEFVAELPKTPSGKVQRFILRNQEVARAREAAAA
ncbi:acetyl-coenzyme A synthetase AcsA [Cupriavidus necator N-1]|jgi:acetyl-CoA synthetase|uniref:Acetyl-coenzyme A synthetase AcsA n=1 Tax=Cupriavidus necator (strain ATCC 43291 / DSM 13513 / CCUG 52238 / LMG 8453 / N-1) TaxID=1042878 RepID=F8GTS3_CUPNN|nr:MULTISPECIES: AMP-binding protein [Cupriavidus]AEI80030.1 acetyl-coenzyme A synthetase AcsA [Cupriavidus necator N-1]KAI3599331.1 Acyl-CoA synthetases (AMP-forming)/AMP-acid ligase [Cupriavidus necator H850]MDX6010335.1 AMP-binding protein [Cupriavidus necator]QUN30258.1 AMP-binding protein [Cupriavidus sp. KK10]